MNHAEGNKKMNRKECFKAMDAVASAAAYPRAKVEQKGFALYGHVAQKEPDAVKSAVTRWLKQLGK